MKLSELLDSRNSNKTSQRPQARDTIFQQSASSYSPRFQASLTRFETVFFYKETHLQNDSYSLSFAHKLTAGKERWTLTRTDGEPTDINVNEHIGHHGCGHKLSFTGLVYGVGFSV